MKTAVYFSTELYNETSSIFKADGHKTIEEDNIKTERLNKIERSDTTLSILYEDGWRLVQAVRLGGGFAYQLFFEKE